MTTSPAVPQLSVESIFVGYGGPIVVRDVTMEVEHREFVLVLELSLIHISEPTRPY